MRLALLSFFLVTLFIAACALLMDKPYGIWFYTHSSGENKNSATIKAAGFINLMPDGTYTADLGHFEYGRWEKKNNELVLISDSKKKELPINYFNSESLGLTVEKDIVANFDLGPALPKGVEDPFSLPDNKWRVKPAHKESPEEIRTRLLNHCKFWEAYFNWALTSSLETVEVRAIPTPIKIWGNGFTLKEYSELPEEWRSCFYDSEDCKVANNMLYEVIEYNDI